MTMSTGWLILADDLTGAADCGIAFAKQGVESVVTWGTEFAGKATVLAVDADSRCLPPRLAAERQVAAQRSYWHPGLRLFKKIDSTLRGQPAAELAAQLACLTGPSGRRAPLAVVAPAFPATGRVTLNGRVIVNGRQLEETPLWERRHNYADAFLPRILETAGISAELIGLDLVRQGAQALFDRLSALERQGIAAAVCDCADEDDLLAIAEASLCLERAVWAGAGGLAAALARKLYPCPSAVIARPFLRGSVIFVIGSQAEASQVQAAALHASGRASRVAVAPEALLAGPGAADWHSARERLQAAFAAGRDVLLEIALAANPDPVKGPALANRLALLVEPFAERIGALVVTGGETACAVLTRLGANGIHLQDEIEPGVPLGAVLGGGELLIVTKAGGFGDAGTFLRCLDKLKA
jgi:uncharacterized protein YgbK (DUF1537 family)